jgi:2-oxoisovalerate dehydrogenase E1 component
MSKATPSSELRLENHHAMVEARVIEERMLLLLRQGGLSKWFSGVGQEAVSVGATSALRPDDFILPMHRNVGVFTRRKVDFDRLFRQLLGRIGGYTEGRDRSFHFGHLPDRIVGMISHLGAMCPVACGLGLAAQLRDSDRVALTFTGDGASSEGDVHEAMNLASVWTLPVIFLIENNQYGLSTPVSEQYACAQLADRASGYGMPGVSVDGNDIEAVYEAVSEAARRARAGGGPSVIECMTFRMRGHEEASGTAYVPQPLMDEWALRDPIERSARGLIKDGLITSEMLAETRQALVQRVRDQVDAAVSEPRPTADTKRELQRVYAPAPPAQPPAAANREMRYVDAVQDALSIEMDRDERVILMGQDIAEYGGVFKATDGLVDTHGRRRVRNTPIIESAAIGAALGLALDGYRPMVEMQFADFITCGFNQIVNNLAKTHYRWGEAVPVVIRAPHGGGLGAGPFHSQSVEAWFTRVPGLKVVTPATPADAKGLLLAAFADPNPVIVLEHKKLYRSVSGPVPEGHYTLPIGQAHVTRLGDDLTVVTYGVGVHWALDAATQLAESGAEIEVIDLRTLLPWDRETVFNSVRKTGRALVLHEDTLTGGFGGELAASIGAHCFEWLDAPVERLAALDTPVPFSPALEVDFLPEARLLDALRTTLAY